MDQSKQSPIAHAMKKHAAAPAFVPSGYHSSMRKDEKFSNNSHKALGNLDSTNLQTSNRFSSLQTPYKHHDKEHQKNRNYQNSYSNSNSSNSFFGARKANIIGYGQNKTHVSYQTKNYGDFHRTSSSGSDKSHLANGRTSPKALNKEREYVNRNKAPGYIPKNHGGGLLIDNDKAAQESVKALETLQQIQEAKPGNKRALLVDLPPYLYSIPALAGFFEPYGEVAMLQILPQKRMWDSDLIDLLGASMCNRLSNQSLCAIVEFYSARMAKFIIGILRKRLPILKFRCALLKPSAAVELTNQAENLGLQNVVVLNLAKGDTGEVTPPESECDEKNDEVTATPENTRPRQSDSESGMDEMSSNSGHRRNAQRNNSEEQPQSSPGTISREQFDSSEHSDRNASCEENAAENSQATTPNMSSEQSSESRDAIQRSDAISQRFVTSMRIKLK